MPAENTKPIHPNILPVASAPHFLLAVMVAAINWRRMGFPEKARITMKWGIIGAIIILIIAANFPLDILKKMWSVGLGINLGTGMALRTIQLPEYQKAMAKRERGVK